jgi:hypothetical protein
MIRAVILLLLAACAYQAKQEKKVEADVDQGRTAASEQEPTVKEDYAPPAFPGQPLQDRLRSRQVKGAKKTWSEDWLKGKFGEDEHLEVEAHVGPGSVFEWLILAGGLAVLLVIGGYAAWKLKPPWLGWLFRIFAPRAPAVALVDSGDPRGGPSTPRAS